MFQETCPTRPNARPCAARAALALAPLALAALLAPAGARSAGAVQVDRLDLPGDVFGGVADQDSLRIVINVPARRLFLVRGEELVKAYPVAVGRPGSPTPRGTFQILQMAKDPTWAPKGRKPVPPGPGNPLGNRWMRISADGYGIHATNDPASIGHPRSHGCVRMQPADAEDLYSRVTLGTRVDITYEVEGWADDGTPTEFPDIYGLAASAETPVPPTPPGDPS